jgi:16S rRNA processing protein RimM
VSVDVDDERGQPRAKPGAAGSGNKPGNKPDARPPFGAFVQKAGRGGASKGAANAANAADGLKDESEASWPADAIEVGAVTDAYGLKGWVKIVAHAQGPDAGHALLGAKRWWLENGRERKSATRIAAKTHGGTIVGQLTGVADRDAALLLRGYRVYVSRDEFPALEADEFYWVDLIGLDVVNDAGVDLGKVADMIDNGAHSVLRVEYPSAGRDGKPVTGVRLIPFVGAYVKTVDQAAKRIVVDWDADY